MLHEVYVFLTAMGSGLTAGLYDLFIKRKALKTKAVVVSLKILHSGF